MDFWPFLTIFVTLVLILFFRRIDKRTINFNKFKKYAEKLSADFNIYVAQKKEDFASSLQDLDAALRRASQILAKIEIADESLKQSFVDVKSEKGELEAIKIELERLKRIKDDFLSEINNLQKSLPSIKKISKRVKKIGLDITDNEKSLKTAFSMLSELENRVNEKTEKALEEVKNTVMYEAKGFFVPIVNEYRENLDLMRTAQSEELAKFKKEAESVTDLVVHKIDELDRSIEELSGRLGTLETENFSSIENRISELDMGLSDTRSKMEQLEKETLRVYLKRAEEEYQKYIASIEKSEAVFKDDVFRRVESRAKDLSSYVTRLEGRVENLLGDIKNETDKYAENLNLRIKAHESEADVLKNRIVSEINEEASKNLLIIKPMVSEMNEKLLKYKKEFNTIFTHIKLEFKAHKERVDTNIASFLQGLDRQKTSLFAQLEERIRETSEQISEINSRLEEEVRKASETVSDEFVVKLKEYESSISALDGKIGDLKVIANTGQKMIEERIESVYLKYEPEIDEKIQNLQRLTEQIYEKERELILQKIEEIISKTAIELDAREAGINALLGKVDDAIQRSEERFKVQEDALLENMNTVKVEARQELMRELENLRALFKEEKERVAERYGEEAKQLNERIEGIGSRVEDLRRVVGKKVEEALKSAEEQVKELETSYLRTGEEMASSARERLSGVMEEMERIREVVKGLKDEVVAEVNEALSQHRKQVERELAGHREVMVELDAREAGINALLGKVDDAIQRSEERFRVQEDTLLENVDAVKVEARQELMRELENLRALFKEEKERVAERYGEEAKQLDGRIEGISGRVEDLQRAMEQKAEEVLKSAEERVEGIGSRVEDLRRVVGKKVEEALKSAEEQVKELETSYLRTGEEMASSARERLSGVMEEMERIREVVKGLKDEVVAEINQSLRQHRQAVDEVFAEHRNDVREKENELVGLLSSIAGNIKTEMERSQEKAREGLINFSKEVEQTRNKIEKRVDDVEKRIINFEKESQVIRKAVQYKEQIEVDIDKLTEILRQLKEDKRDVASLRKIIQNLKKEEGDISAKVRHLKSEKKLVSDIAKNAEQAVGLISVVEEKIRFIESEKELLDKIEGDIGQISEKIVEFGKKSEGLKNRENDIEVAIEAITKTKEFISNLEKRADILKDGFKEIKDIEEDIKKRLSLIDEKARTLSGNERRVNEVLERFKGMDALVTDIEVRTKQLKSTREWLAKTESRLANLTADADRLVNELKDLMEKHDGLVAAGAEKGTVKGKVSREAESKVKTVLTLFDQKWTIPEICKVTKMSRGEVELILELNNR